MKHYSSPYSPTGILKAGRRLCLLVSLFLPLLLSAQTDSTAAEEAEPELISPSLDLLSIQKGDHTVDLKAVLKAKINGTFNNLHSMKIRYFLVTDTAEIQLGQAITDRSGVATLNIQEDKLLAGKDGLLHFKATVSSNKSMEAGEAEVSVKRAILTVTPVKEDSVYSLQVKLTDLSTGTETPVPETEFSVLVKRTFNPLKIADATTDDNGEATAEIPSGLPGDAKGNITLLTRVTDNETYGNLEVSTVQPWGAPVSDKVEDQPRALWSSHPPIWMLITFIVLMAAVWGHYIVIVYELFRLRKEEPHPVHATN